MSITEDNIHAILAPSSAERWLACPGSVLMEKGIVEIESEYAKEGTMAHTVAAQYLEKGAADTLGDLDDEACDHILVYTNEIKKLAKGHQLLVEQKLPIGHVTLEPDATGTGDAIILHNDGKTIEVNDLKFGMGVRVYAEENPQMMLYALGALRQFDMFGNWEKVVLRVHQPRLNHLDTWECSVDYLKDFADKVSAAAKDIWAITNGGIELNPDLHLRPSEEACRWCKAKAACPAAINHALTVAAGDFTDISSNPTAKLEKALQRVEHLDNKQLAWMMQNADLLEGIVKAVRAKTEAELFAGHEVPGFKIVQGKRGNRKWSDEALVKQEFKTLRLTKDEMYNMKLISPADAEKLFKQNPKRWAKMTAYVTQADGKPSVAPSTDPRPALSITAVEDDFADLTKEPLTIAQGA